MCVGRLVRVCSHVLDGDDGKFGFVLEELCLGEGRRYVVLVVEGVVRMLPVVWLEEV